LSHEAERIRQEYAARHADARLLRRYRFTEPAHLLLVQQRERRILALLRRYGFAERLGAARVLDVGCGTGGLLLDLLRYGARPDALAGIDLLPHVVEQARERLPSADLRCGDATALPYADASFDLITQMTVLSTLLEPALRARMAAEMRRVLRPDGLIISYDLRYDNPRNPGVRAVRLAELRTLFPDCAVDARPITLAPPLARRLASRAWWLAALMQELPPLQTHLLAAIRPRHRLPSAPTPAM
jgi:SAM-dependent methyltransferase